jgi:hypothetical protein
MPVVFRDGGLRYYFFSNEQVARMSEATSGILLEAVRLVPG